MNPFSASYLPIDSPSYFESPLFWLLSAVAVALTVGFSVMLWVVDRRRVAAEVQANAKSPYKIMEKPSMDARIFPLMLALLLASAYGVTLAMESVPAYSSVYNKVDENIKAKYLIESVDIETPSGEHFVVDPATGNTLTQIDATIARDGKVGVVSYHASFDKVTGEPTLKPVIDSPAFSVSPENLLRK